LHFGRFTGGSVDPGHEDLACFREHVYWSLENLNSTHIKHTQSKNTQYIFVSIFYSLLNLQKKEKLEIARDQWKKEIIYVNLFTKILCCVCVCVLFVYVYVYVCMWCICVCMRCICMYVCYMCMCLCMYVCMWCICMCLCMYIIIICVCVFIFMCMHVYGPCCYIWFQSFLHFSK